MELLGSASLFRASVLSVAFNADGTQVTACIAGGQIAVTPVDRFAPAAAVTRASIAAWDVSTPSAPTRISVTNTERVASLAWSRDGRVLAAGHLGGSVSLWRL